MANPDNRDRNIEMARRVASEVAKAGGRTFFVGGIVRDWLMGLENKDVDIEVHGVSVAGLEDILDGLGKRTTMGASFGIMGLRHYDLDIAMPRSEKATGRGHKDFEVCVDPFIGPKKAAMRRDFTINALMQDVLTGEVLDFFGGREDLARRRIRHVCDESYVEDPLRAFRAAQFAARFGFGVAEETRALSATMDVAALAGERVMGELEKALLKAERPSVFFEQLRGMEQLDVWFSELAALEEPSWRHTLLALDAAAPLRSEAEKPLDFMMAALCFALDGEHGEDAGLSRTKRLLKRLTGEVQLNQYVLNMSACRARMAAMVDRGGDELSWMQLFDDSVSPKELILLERAVRLSTKPPDRAGDFWNESEGALWQRLSVYRRRMEAPGLMGRDLIAAGIRPGPRMGEALALSHRLALMGRPKEEQLQRALAFLGGAGNEKTKQGDSDD